LAAGIGEQELALKHHKKWQEGDIFGEILPVTTRSEAAPMDWRHDYPLRPVRRGNLHAGKENQLEMRSARLLCSVRKGFHSLLGEQNHENVESVTCSDIVHGILITSESV
jgi:hypothetical protein